MARRSSISAPKPTVHIGVFIQRSINIIWLHYYFFLALYLAYLSSSLPLNHIVYTITPICPALSLHQQTQIVVLFSSTSVNTGKAPFHDFGGSFGPVIAQERVCSWSSFFFHHSFTLSAFHLRLELEMRLRLTSTECVRVDLGAHSAGFEHSY